MRSFDKLYFEIIDSFNESNTAGSGGVYGDTATASPKVDDYKIDYAAGDSRNLFGGYQSKKKSKKSKKKKSKFPWLQRRNLVYN